MAKVEKSWYFVEDIRIAGIFLEGAKIKKISKMCKQNSEMLLGKCVIRGFPRNSGLFRGILRKNPEFGANPEFRGAVATLLRVFPFGWWPTPVLAGNSMRIPTGPPAGSGTPLDSSVTASSPYWLSKVAVEIVPRIPARCNPRPAVAP